MGLYMSVFYALHTFEKGISLELYNLLGLIFGLLVYIFSMLLLNNTVQKFDFKPKGSHTVLLFAFFTAIISEAIVDLYIIIASLLILLAFRNILSLQNEKQVKSKIFNASLCIGLASMAHFWSSVFFIMLYFGIYYYEPRNYRNWIIPLIGIATVMLLTNMLNLIVFDEFYSWLPSSMNVRFGFTLFDTKIQLFGLGIMMICFLFFATIFINKFKRKSIKSKPVLRLTILYALIAIALVFGIPGIRIKELIFLSVPLSIMGTSYLELDYNPVAKEINLWVFILLPFLIFLL